MRAHVGSAKIFAHTRDVILRHFFGDGVDFFFDFVCFVKRVHIHVDVRLHNLLEKVVDMLLQIAYLAHRRVRKTLSAVLQFVGVFYDVFGIVAHALDVGYRVERACKIGVVLIVELEFREFDDETRDLSVEKVKLVFVLTELFHFRIVKSANHVAGKVVVVQCDFRHIDDFVFRLLDGDRGSGEHVLVDIVQFFGRFFRFFALWNYLRDESDQQFCQRKHNHDGENVEDGVEHSKLRLRCAREHLCKQITEGYHSFGRYCLAYFAHHHCNEHKHHDAGYVEQKVYKSGALCVGARSHASDDCNHARADVRAHREIYALIEGDKSRKNHRDGNRRHHRRALNDRGENRAYENEKYGVCDECKEILDRFEFGKRFHRPAHHIESYEQHSETRQNAADFFGDVFFCKRHRKRAYTGKSGEHNARGYGVFKHTESGDLSRDCGADVCPVDDGCGLHKRHNARVDETYHHHGGCARTLNCRRCERAYAHAHEFAFGRARKQLFEFV